MSCSGSRPGLAIWIRLGAAMHRPGANMERPWTAHEPDLVSPWGQLGAFMSHLGHEFGLWGKLGATLRHVGRKLSARMRKNLCFSLVFQRFFF